MWPNYTLEHSNELNGPSGSDEFLDSPAFGNNRARRGGNKCK